MPAGRVRGEADGPQPVVRLEATVYRLGVPAASIVGIDTTALAEARTISEFDEMMRTLGNADILYHVDQTVNLRERPKIETVADQPYLAGSVTDSKGVVHNQIRRTNVGVTFQVDGGWIPSGATQRLYMTLLVMISNVEDSGVQVDPETSAPIFRKITQNHNGPVEFGRPLVLLNLDGAASDRSNEAVAVITRVVVYPITP